MDWLVIGYYRVHKLFDYFHNLITNDFFGLINYSMLEMYFLFNKKITFTAVLILNSVTLGIYIFSMLLIHQEIK